ncbi:hypothetical protein C8R43DRAFT_946716 [Mycena crocata]|nr:hypothetical protein C8R43DRAFT_946716 [Mycena crocata]
MSRHSTSTFSPSPTFDATGYSSSSGSSPASDFSFVEMFEEGPGHACALAIASLPADELRDLMAKLATKPSLQRVISRELLSRTQGRPQALQAVPPDAICANCQRVCRATASNERCSFHPGHLEDDVYEFVSYTPEGRELRIRRTLPMWTCCAEEPQALGCAEAAGHLWRAD